MLATAPWYTAGKQHEYTFTVYEIGEDFPDTSGVYIFAVPEGESWRPIYFGQTESLKETITDKLLAQAHYDCITREGASHVLIFETGHNAEVRRKIVAGLMAEGKAVCNL